MPIVETFYRLKIKSWANSDDTIECSMTRASALRIATEILELLAVDRDDPVTLALTGSLTETGVIEDRP